MVKKILLNIFLNIALIVLILCIFWSIKNGFYLYAVAATPPFAMLIFLKVRLAKSVREMTRSGGNKDQGIKNKEQRTKSQDKGS